MSFNNNNNNNNNRIIEKVSMQPGLNSLVNSSHLSLHCLFKPTSHA